MCQNSPIIFCRSTGPLSSGRQRYHICAGQIVVRPGDGTAICARVCSEPVTRRETAACYNQRQAENLPYRRRQCALPSLTSGRSAPPDRPPFFSCQRPYRARSCRQLSPYNRPYATRESPVLSERAVSSLDRTGRHTIFSPGAICSHQRFSLQEQGLAVRHLLWYMYV